MTKKAHMHRCPSCHDYWVCEGPACPSGDLGAEWQGDQDGNMYPLYASCACPKCYNPGEPRWLITTIDGLDLTMYLLNKEQWGMFKKKEPFGNVLAFNQIGYLINYCKVHGFYIEKEAHILKPVDKVKDS